MAAVVASKGAPALLIPATVVAAGAVPAVVAVGGGTADGNARGGRDHVDGVIAAAAGEGRTFLSMGMLDTSGGGAVLPCRLVVVLLLLPMPFVAAARLAALVALATVETAALVRAAPPLSASQSRPSASLSRSSTPRPARYQFGGRTSAAAAVEVGGEDDACPPLRSRGNNPRELAAKGTIVRRWRVSVS